MPWQRLNFLPEPQGQGSLRPTLRPSTLAAGVAVWGPRLSLRVCTARRGPPAATGPRAALGAGSVVESVTWKIARAIVWRMFARS